jgi:hypothetical protein
LDHEARTGGAAAFLKHLAPGGMDGVHRRNWCLNLSSLQRFCVS